jgi:predicted nucleotidyltransferase
MHIDKQKIDAISEICKSGKVKSLFAFGSVTRNDFNENSDIDLVVDFNETDPFTYTDLYFDFKNRVEEILKRQVDLLEERAIRNKLFRKQLEETKVQIYGNQVQALPDL